MVTVETKFDLMSNAEGGAPTLPGRKSSSSSIADRWSHNIKEESPTGAASPSRNSTTKLTAKFEKKASSEAVPSSPPAKEKKPVSYTTPPASVEAVSKMSTSERLALYQTTASSVETPARKTSTAQLAAKFEKPGSPGRGSNTSSLKAKFESPSTPASPTSGASAKGEKKSWFGSKTSEKPTSPPQQTMVVATASSSDAVADEHVASVKENRFVRADSVEHAAQVKKQAQQQQSSALAALTDMPKIMAGWMTCITDQLNDAFANGQPTDTWPEAGVLFHAFDALDGHDTDAVAVGDPGVSLDIWNGCSTSSTWCFGLDFFSASMLNRRLPHYFNQYYSGATGAPKAGFLLNTDVVGPDGIMCMFPFDAGTVGSGGGCPSVPCPACGDLDYCYYEGSRLECMLLAHEARWDDGGCGQATCDYNEIIIDGSFWHTHLPQIIRAVFYPLGEAGAANVARSVHAAFAQAFPERAQLTPLVSFDGNRLDAPFRLEEAR